MGEGEDAEKGARTRNLEINPAIGDIIICQEAGETIAYLFMGEERLVNLTTHKILNPRLTTSAIEALFGREVWVTIRPAMAK